MPIHVLKLRMRFVVEKDDNEFHAYCPQLTGLHVGGATEQEALSNVIHAAQLYIESLLEHQDPIPVGVVESHRRYGWAELCQFVRHAFTPSRSFIEDVTLNATA